MMTTIEYDYTPLINQGLTIFPIAALSSHTSPEGTERVQTTLWNLNFIA